MVRTLAFCLALLIPAAATGQELVLTVGGDVCLNRSAWSPRPDGAGNSQWLTTWSKLTSGIAPLLKGADFNFANLETVVVGSESLPKQKKKYTFQTHVEGVKHLVDIGFNLFSLANNHAYDFGAEGALSTLRHMEGLKSRGLHSSGLGRNEAEAIAPEVFQWQGRTIAFSSVGIVTNMSRAHRAGPSKPGTVRFRDDKDYTRVLQALKKVKADLKLLSIHYGTERKVTLDRGQRERFMRAIREAGVDVVIGHHAHVVRALERTAGNKVLFYGLGNYLIRGARNMGPLPDKQDYGLFSRLYLNVSPETGKFEIQAVEAIPLTNMHFIARPMKSEEAKRRIEVLNRLSQKSIGEDALLFDVLDDGRGLACFGENQGPRARKVCRDLTPF
jgi:poly-gamma-glutamate synthesis protein (capsule biosynthesis protein)